MNYRELNLCPLCGNPPCHGYVRGTTLGIECEHCNITISASLPGYIRRAKVKYNHHKMMFKLVVKWNTLTKQEPT